MKVALTRVAVAVVCVAFVAVLPSCDKKGETVRSEVPKQAVAPPPPADAPEPDSSAPAPATSFESAEVVVFQSESEWLRAEQLGKDVDGGWVSGDFLPDRNKIDIHTRDVTQFSIDVGKLPIDWGRLVVVGIDGRNSELRQRDFDVYHIARDAKGKWVVLEP